LQYDERDKKTGKKTGERPQGTAQFVAAKKLQKTIVFTGAAQPASMKDTDADFNLGLALGAALFAKPGVYVAMNGHVFKWNKCKKDDHGYFVAINDAETVEESE
jgi:L-asparaginase/Glu-tRNA(Gln) amidotransferase subunit D